MKLNHGGLSHKKSQSTEGERAILANILRCGVMMGPVNGGTLVEKRLFRGKRAGGRGLETHT